MANKKVSQLTSKPAVNLTDLFLIADPTSGQAFKTTISDLGTAIGSGVSSVNTLVGAVVLDTDDIQELVSPTNKWFTDTRARAAISAGTGISYNSGTGVITNAVTSGQIATALGYTPADDSLVVKLAGTQTITGDKTFSLGTRHDAGIILKQQFATNQSGYTGLAGITNGLRIGIGTPNYSDFIFSNSAIYTYTFPNATGTIALTSNLSSYLPLTGGTLTGDLTLSSGNPRLYFTDTDNNPDYFISNTDGTFTVYDVTNSTSRFTIGTTGNGTFGGNLTVGQIIRSGGTSSQFLKADGSVDSTAYLPLGGGTLTGALFATSASFSGFVGFGGNTSPLAAIDVTGAGIFSSSVRSSGYYLTGMTSGSGALYYSSGSNRVTVANYNTNGIVLFEVNGGAAALTLNANSSATFASSISATDATFSGNVTAQGGYLYGQTTSSFVRLDNTIGSQIGFLNYADITFDSEGIKFFTGTGTSGSRTQKLIIKPNSDGIYSGAMSFSSSVTATSLLVNGTTVTDNHLVNIIGNQSSANVGIVLNNTNTTHARIYALTNINGNLAFYDYTANAQRVTITSAGNVGIGTTAPFGTATDRTVLSVNGTTDVSINVGTGGSQRAYLYGASSSAELGTIGALPLTFATNNTERMRITSSGVIAFNGSSSPNSGGIDKFSMGFENGVDGWLQTWGGRPLSLNSQGNRVLIGTRTDNGVANLEVNGGIYSMGTITITFAGVNVTANTPLYWNNSTGRVGINTSSKKYKTDIVSLTKKQAEIALKLNPVEYTRIETNERELGFIAEEVKEAGLGLIVPEINGECITIDYSKLSVIAIAMIKEQQLELKSLKAKIETLENK